MQTQHRNKMHFIEFDGDTLHVYTYVEVQKPSFWIRLSKASQSRVK